MTQKLQNYNIGALQLAVNPLLHTQGELIRAVNVVRDSSGAWKKRPGYTTYLGTVGGTITKLWSFTLNNGIQFWNYAVTGGSVMYSQQGTGAWTISGNGTLTNGARPGHAILDNVMIIGDGTAASRHTSDGTSFSNTTSAPAAPFWTDFQGRIFAGTSSTLSWSTTGTASDWTTDSSSIQIPGPGAINWVAKTGDRVVTSKNSGVMHRYDGFNLVDLSTNQGPSSPHSAAKVEDYYFYLNRRGVFSFNGAAPQLTSLPIERQIYNDAGKGIQGGTFDLAPGIVHKYDYYLAVGSITDDLTDETVTNGVLAYDYRRNEWRNYDLAVLPTAWGTYRDSSGVEQLIFGDATGQCYSFAGTALTDNGSTIASVMEWVEHAGVPEDEKEWKMSWFFFNPGAVVQCQVAYVNTFTKRVQNWITLGQPIDGVIEFNHKAGARSRLMLVKITEASRQARYSYYGCSHSVDIIKH